MRIAGILLAGGQSRRMGGGDKCLRKLGQETILRRIIDRVAPQVARLALNANGDPARFAAFGLPVLADQIAGFAGPLAGILAGMDWASAARPTAEFLASFATDAPFLPRDLVARLAAAQEESGADIACGASGGRLHPVFAIWKLSLRDDLRRALVEEGCRKVEAWAARHRLAVVEYPTDPIDPFFNVNGPEDLLRAAALLPGADCG